jgi:hypothetical protein
MARTVRDAALETRTARARLKSSGKPYYRSIDPGLHLGYRKGVAGGKWVMRWYVGEGDYRLETIGVADDTAEADGVAVIDFKQAQALIRQRHLELVRVAKGLASRDGPYTVGRCIGEALSRQLSTSQEGARSNQVSCCDGILPLRRRFGSKRPQRRSGDEVALKIERVVDGGMDTEEALGGSS